MLDFLNDSKDFSYMDINLSTDAIIYIDTNILMSEESDYCIKKFTSKHSIIVPKEQYNEIYKLRQSEGKKGYEARRAFGIIEKLIRRNIVSIPDLENKAVMGSYADPIFIKSIIEHLKQNQKVIFITEDADLRIRLTSEIQKNALNSNLLSLNTLSNIKEKVSTRDIETSGLKKAGKVGLGILGAAVFVLGMS